MTNDEFAPRLAADLCETFAVRAIGDGRWVVTTPLIYDDGDALPVFVVYRDSWSLTDQGMAVSHLFFDEFDYTDARLRRMQVLADSCGARMSETHELFLTLSEAPNPYDIGTFLQLVAQVRGVALTAATEKDQTRYVTTVRQRVIELLASPDFDANWSPPQLRQRTRATYRADLHVRSSDHQDVVIFAASTSDKANVSTLSVGHFKRVLHGLRPLLAYHPDRVASEAIYRFQDEVEDDSAVVPVPPDDVGRLVSALRERHVAI